MAEGTPARGAAHRAPPPSRAAILRTGSGDIKTPPLRLRGKKGKRNQKRPVREAEESDEEEWEDMEEGFQGFSSVVKVFATIQEPDYGNPWQTLSVENATGSAVVVETSVGLRVLTAAHVVADQTFLQVQRTGVENPDKYVAQVYAVWHECDLALLQVDDPLFWESLEPAELGNLPSLRDLILVAGFPVGGEELSITEGVVSRIEGQPYSHSQRLLLAVTVDAAINAGNSGGPVFNDSGELVGIAFQALTDAENTGHIVPPPVVRHFLEGIAACGPSGYKGFPSIGVAWQQLTNPYLRTHLLMGRKQTGVLVTDVFYNNTCFGVLKRNDVILSINGRQVANNGTVAFERHGRVDFEIMVTMFQCGTAVTLKILREGQEMEVSVNLMPLHDLVPLAQHDRAPPYFMYCGLVFQPLSLDYLESQGRGDAEFGFLLERGTPKEESMQVIILSQGLTDAINVGYDELANQIIILVNGKKPRDLRDFVTIVESCTEPTLRFETSCHDMIILPGPATPEAAEANKRIMSRYHVGADRSPDLIKPDNMELGGA